MKKVTTWTAVFWIVALVATGCSSDGLAEGESGEIQAVPSQIAFPSVSIGETGQETLTLLNTDDEQELTIFDVELRTGEDGHIDQLALAGAPGERAEIEPNGQIEIDVEYTPERDAPANRGEIVVFNSDPRYSQDNPLIVPVNTLANTPEFFAEPPVVRFQRMQIGESAEQTLRITNIGSGPMTIYEEPSYSGGADFRVQDTNRDYPLELQPYSTSGAQASPDDYVVEVDVQYQPLGDGGDTGTIQVLSNDVDNPPAQDGEQQLHEIEVLADAEAPCIEVDGRTRNFGQVPIGEVAREVITLNNCGSEALHINSLLLDEENATTYHLDLGNWDQSGDGSLDDTVVLGPEQSDSFIVEFDPLEEGTRRAEVTIFSNDPIQPELKIDLVARGAEGSCPEAVATATIEGVPMDPGTSITVAPLDDVILDGSESTDQEGQVVSWEWEVLEDPPGIDVELGPTASDPQDQDQSRRHFQPLTAGVYRIGLTVQDDSGFQSCDQAEVQITAIPDQNIHIELTWTNPEDPDETNEIGSDVDIHFVKMGPGQWFEAPYSIWYQNPNQNEDPIWNPEDPSLDIDVTDGAGPENVTMRTPDDCQWYAVGVHYFQKRFGTAYATVRIYINGDLRFYRPHFPLEETGHFWDVARIHWDDQTSQATIIDVDGFYPAMPAGQEPVVTESMEDSELCTAEGLY